MSVVERTVRFAAACAAGLLLAACHTAPEAAASAAPASGAGKPVAPIALDYELLGEPALGVPLEIRIRAEPQTEMLAFRIELQGSAALTLASAPVEGPFDLRAGESVSIVVTVVPTAAGRHHLSVLAEGTVAQQPQARSVLVPVSVGGTAPASGADTRLGTDEAGQPIRSLPAQENR